ncbi:hypothetical protein GCM10027160_11140 [Streptomyces calidiresistens]
MSTPPARISSSDSRQEDTGRREKWYSPVTGIRGRPPRRTERASTPIGGREPPGRDPIRRCAEGAGGTVAPGAGVVIARGTGRGSGEGIETFYQRGPRTTTPLPASDSPPRRAHRGLPPRRREERRAR